MRRKKSDYIVMPNVEGGPACESLFELARKGFSCALVVDGRHAFDEVPAAVRSVGLRTAVAYTQDMAASPRLSLAEQCVSIGERADGGAFDDAYLVLAAAQSAGADLVLLVDSPLAGDVDFVGMARGEGLGVYAVDAERVIAGAFGGMTAAWRSCACAIGLVRPVDEQSWRRCPACGGIFAAHAVFAAQETCPRCGLHFRMTSRQRFDLLFDAGTVESIDDIDEGGDPLDFPGYAEKLASTRLKTRLSEAVSCARGRIAGMPAVVCVMDSTFFMGSMGRVVGERIARAADRATGEGLPLVIFCASGGARMQEGLVSLMQMAKVSCAIRRHTDAGLAYLSAVTDPTTGGVTASFAMQGDVVFAEPGALVGFAGRRVIQDTTGETLPDGFQTAEFALEHGLIDAVVDRASLRCTVAALLALLGAGAKGAPCSVTGPDALARALQEAPSAHELRVMEERGTAVAPSVEAWDSVRASLRAHRILAPASRTAAHARAATDASANPAWRSVQAARDTHRPTALHYLSFMVDGFIELHGDRAFSDDAAVVAGIGWVSGRAAVIIAQEKGATLDERVRRNFGCPQPEGYRKSMRAMDLARRFGLPVVCLVDTQGAFCGKEAEERGQGNAIAENLACLAGLPVPVVTVIVGEGGSGGALALALSDAVAMQEHAVYSVLSPEGFASILWKDRSRAPEAAAAMRMNAYEIFEMGIVDTVLEEGEGTASENPVLAADAVRRYVERKLDELCVLDGAELVNRRQRRFAAF
ncbi:acetyl-CoA carboxylase, carboxyltransferase subunit beta [uncultured Slackia sp.]|uniref:acetyl-CoA carboxylase, carboxyltransferase subunit beta n=1 Tax=uncultured Slackia sp. TaxID=665903 RepID=UPI0026DF7784|nr:acetyl-CoA carboxylase, carboxyltransferase subunit beta [uncultured Slackia sp.]